jgi:hypothetical protein
MRKGLGDKGDPDYVLSADTGIDQPDDEILQPPFFDNRLFVFYQEGLSVKGSKDIASCPSFCQEGFDIEVEFPI